MTVGGQHGIADMDYHTDVNIPLGRTGEKIGSELSNVLSQAGINNVSTNLSSVPVGVAITGSMKSPKFALSKAKYTSSDGSATATIKDQVSSAITEKVDTYKQQADSIVQQKKEEVQEKIEEKKNEAAAKLREQLKKKLPF